MTAPLPIAVVMSTFEPGGTERQMIELIRRLDPSRWAVHLACFKATGAWFGRAAQAAVSVAEFPVDSFRTPQILRQMWTFAHWCRDTHIAVVHTAELQSNLFALPAAALAGVPVRVANRHEVNPNHSAAQLATERAAYACAHRIVANSRDAAEQLLRERVPAWKVAVVPAGLDGLGLHPRRAAGLRRKVIVVARLRPGSGHDVLMNAAADVLRRFPDAVFEIVGVGPELQPLLARADARGLTDAFHFVGHRDDVPARLAAADVFVWPSRSETLPDAVLDAMTAGLPIVASGVGGILELIDDERSGLLVPPGDPRALADRICRVMSDPSLGTRLGEAARAAAQARYSFDRMVAGFELVYLTALGHRGLLHAGGPQPAVP